MLKKYVDSQKDVPAQIHNSLASGDRNTAERLAHTVKGTSGNIGATGLQAMAAEIESAIKNGKDAREVEKILAVFAVAHVAMVGGLKKALQAPGDGPGKEKAIPETRQTAVDKAKASEVCQKLADLLSASDGEAVDFLQKESAVLNGIIGQDSYRLIDKTINDYDFEKALSILREASKKAGLKLD